MKVKYVGCIDAQAKWGQSEDPRGVLIDGNIYDVDKVEVHTWHTLYHIAGHKYNSTCFEQEKP